MKRTPRPTCLPALLLLAALAWAFGPAPAALAQNPGQNLGLPQAAMPGDVAKLLAKPPAGLEIVDIRPSAQYADYALPGSLNLDAATVLADETFLAGSGPLLLVDKDGSEAFAVAGVLSRKTSRPIMVLKGGLAAWWTARELDSVARETPLSPAPADPARPDKTPAKGENSSGKAAPETAPATLPSPTATPSSTPLSSTAPAPQAVKTQDASQ